MKLVFKDASIKTCKIGPYNFTFVNEDVDQVIIDRLKKLITFLEKNKIEYEFVDECEYWDEVAYGIRLSIPSRGIESINCLDCKDVEYGMNYLLDHWQTIFEDILIIKPGKPKIRRIFSLS